MLSTEPRARLQELAAARATSLAALSRMIGRGPAYLQQWVRYGSPRVLAERDRCMLANFFGVSQEALGGLSEAATFRIPRLDVAASAGPGAINDEEALLALIRRYAARLEHHARAAPYNWFNFYDFWGGHEASDTDRAASRMARDAVPADDAAVQRRTR